MASLFFTSHKFRDIVPGMKFLSQSLLFIFVFLVALSFGQDVPVYVNTQQANIREAPTVNSKVIATFNINTKLTVSANSGNWYYVTKGKTHGWIHYSTIRKAYRSETDEPAEGVNRAPDEWKEIGSSNSETFFYNPSRVTRSGSTATAWIKYVDKESNKLSAMNLNEYRCSNKEWRLTASTRYNPDGSILRSWTDPKQQWSPVVPESIGESIMQTVCSFSR
jgi:uncharacterized protein YgiM (DUF1202 family)